MRKDIMDKKIKEWDKLCPDAPPNVVQFVHKFGPEIVGGVAEKTCLVFPSVALAQAALETGWGKSATATIFGIKGKGNVARTTEFIDGKEVHITDEFKAFSNLGEAVGDYVRLMLTPRYTKLRGAKTPEEACEALQEAGYATDPAYAKQLRSIIKGFKLWHFDA